MMITPRQSCSCEEVATPEAARTLGVRLQPQGGHSDGQRRHDPYS